MRLRYLASVGNECRHEPPARYPHWLDGQPLFEIGLQYNVTQDGRAANPCRTIPLQHHSTR